MTDEPGWGTCADLAGLLLFVGLLSVLPGTAAAEIPTFDSIVYCERLREEVSADHNVSAQCLSVEEYARSELEEFWPGAEPVNAFT